MKNRFEIINEQARTAEINQQNIDANWDSYVSRCMNSLLGTSPVSVFSDSNLDMVREFHDFMSRCTTKNMISLRKTITNTRTNKIKEVLWHGHGVMVGQFNIPAGKYRTGSYGAKNLVYLCNDGKLRAKFDHSKKILEKKICTFEDEIGDLPIASDGSNLRFGYVKPEYGEMTTYYSFVEQDLSDRLSDIARELNPRY